MREGGGTEKQKHKGNQDLGGKASRHKYGHHKHGHHKHGKASHHKHKGGDVEIVIKK